MGLDVTYKGQQIAQLTEDGNLTLETAGKYCEGNIGLAYSGGSAFSFFEERLTVYPHTYAAGFDCSQLSESLVLHFKKATKLGSLFKLCSKSGTPTKLKMVLDQPITDMWNIFYSCTVFSDIEIEGDLSNVTNYEGMFLYAQNLRPLFEIDFTSVTDSRSATHCLWWNQTYLRYKANTLSVSASLNYGNASTLLDTDSMVSVANGLNESASGQTLTLKAAQKAACDSIMGTVAMDQSNTYHVFTYDAGGSVSLTDFITNTKGWTLA